MLAMAKVQEELNNILEYEESAELTEQQQQEVALYINDLLQQQAGKVDNFCQWLKLAEAEADAIAEEGKRLIAKSKSLQNRIAYMKQAAADFMSSHEIQKLKGNAYSIGLRKSESVDVFDMEALQASAPEFVKTKIEYSPDKTAIKNAIKTGHIVPGTSLAIKEHIRVA